MNFLRYLIMILSILVLNSCGQDIDCQLVEKSLLTCYQSAYNSVTEGQSSSALNSKQMCESYKKLSIRSENVFLWSDCMIKLDPRFSTSANPVNNCTSNNLADKAKDPIQRCYNILASTIN